MFRSLYVYKRANSFKYYHHTHNIDIKTAVFWFLLGGGGGQVPSSPPPPPPPPSSTPMGRAFCCYFCHILDCWTSPSIYVDLLFIRFIWLIHVFGTSNVGEIPADTTMCSRKIVNRPLSIDYLDTWIWPNKFASCHVNYKLVLFHDTKTLWLKLMSYIMYMNECDWS